MIYYGFIKFYYISLRLVPYAFKNVTLILYEQYYFYLWRIDIMNKREIAENPLSLTRLKHCEAIRINNKLYTVKYGERGEYLLYRIYGKFELIK